MPFLVQSARPNYTAIVVVQQGGEERTVRVRGSQREASEVLTADMREQKKLGYVQYVQVDKIEAEASDRLFTEDEILGLKKGQLVKLVKMFPEMEILANQNKEDLQVSLLAFDVPYVNPSDLE